MKIVERQFEVARPSKSESPFGTLQNAGLGVTGLRDKVLRAVITRTTSKKWFGEMLVMEDAPQSDTWDEQEAGDLFWLDRRRYEDTSSFNAVIIIPTGIGAAIGGHAGPVVKFFGAFCDTVVTHPNVVNASDINEMPENALYVEGSVLTRMMMGQIGLQPVRNNRVLMVVDDDNPFFTNAAINAVNAARASYGFNCPKVVKLKPSFEMITKFSPTRRASGELNHIDRLFDLLNHEKGNFDAVALSSHMTMPEGYRDAYFAAPGDIVNLWGGAEAMLTHAISHYYGVPSAHSPMALTMDEVLWDGVAEPRLAAETVSITFLQCILKGLQRSPRIIMQPAAEPGCKTGNFFDVTNVSVLVQPDCVIGQPTLAALEQGIPVIAVGENKNLMQNDLEQLPWASGQYHRAESYLSAAGMACAIKAGIDQRSLRRPIRSVPVESYPKR
jgi:Protein of unknown function (DUF3326)